MRSWIDLDPWEEADPRLLQARDNNQEHLYSTYPRHRVQDMHLWAIIRCSLIHEQWNTRISSPPSVQHSVLLRCWGEQYWHQHVVCQEDLFPDEDSIDKYIFNQWTFALNNTYYAVDNQSWQNTFKWDYRYFPRHLGVTWHIGRSPQEIYETARKLIANCLDITPECGKTGAFTEHLWREVSKCVEEISQFAVNGMGSSWASGGVRSDSSLTR